MMINDVRIKAGWDEALIDLVNIESLTPTGGSPQTFKAGRAGMVYFALSNRQFNEGDERADLAGSVSFAGFQQVIYAQPAMHPDSFDWLVDNYRGQVTVYLPLRGTDGERWNAYLRFNSSASAQRPGWVSVDWIFTLVELST
jgi:hypothetical protein